MPLGAYIEGQRCTREDAFLACIDEREKSRDRYLRGELLFYAQRRRPRRVSAHGPFNICSVWHHLCAETSVRQRLCAQGPYQGMQFRTALGTRFLAAAQNDNKDRSERQGRSCRTTIEITQDDSEKRSEITAGVLSAEPVRGPGVPAGETR